MQDLITKIRAARDATRASLEDAVANLDAEEDLLASLSTRAGRVSRAMTGAADPKAAAPVQQPPAPTAAQVLGIVTPPPVVTIVPITQPVVTQPTTITVPARYTFRGIATCWLNREDEVPNRASLADGTEFVDGLGKTLLAVSLPCARKAGRMIHVWMPATPGNVLVCYQPEVGPWSTHCPFITTGILPPATGWIGQKVIQDHVAPMGGWVPVAQATQPHGNQLTCNGAIIDITPAGWSAVNGKSAEENWAGSPTADVCFQVYEPDGSQTITVPAPIQHPAITAATMGGDPTASIVAHALALRGSPTGPADPFQYDPNTNGGRLGCAQAASTILHQAGVIPHIELSVDGLRALLHQIGARVVTDEKPGRVVILGSTANTSGHGHVGVLVSEGGVAHLVNNHSSTQHVGDDVFDPSARPVVEILAVPGAL